MTDQQFSIWLQQLSQGGAAGGAPSGGPGGGAGYQPPRPGGIPGGYGGGMGATSPTRQFTPQAGGGLWPGGAYPSYGRQIEGMRDFTNGPRRAEDLLPGYHGQNVISTDRPLPGELGNPNMGPGTLYPKWGEPAASNDTAFFPGANIEPPDLPGNVGAGGSWPFDVRDFPSGYPDVPGQVQIGTENNPIYEPGGGGGPSPFFDPFETPMGNDFGFGPSPFGDYPGSPDFTPSDQFLPSPPEDATVMQPGGTVYNPNSYTPFTDFPTGDQPTPGRGGFEPMGGGDPFGTGGSVGIGDNPSNFNYAYGPNGETYVYDQDWNWVGQTPGGGTAPSTAGNGGAPPAPGFFTPNTSAPNSFTINPSDPNNNLTRGGVSMPLYPTSDQVFPQPSMFDELGRPTDWQGAGQFFKDAAGNIVNAAGKIVQAARDAAGGLVNNIMNDPGYSSPDYLAQIGYNPGQGTGSMWPGGSEGYLQDNPEFRAEHGITGPMEGGNLGGVGGQGGTVAGGGTVNAPHWGSTAIGFGGNLGGGGPVNPAALGGGRGLSPIALSELMKLYKGLYTSRDQWAARMSKYPAPALTRAAMSIPGATQTGYEQFHSGQVQLHNLFLSNPAYFQSLMGRYQKGGQAGAKGPPTKLSRHTPANQPV